MRRVCGQLLSVLALTGLLGGCTLFGVSYESETTSKTTEVKQSPNLESRVEALELRIELLERELAEKP